MRWQLLEGIEESDARLLVASSRRRRFRRGDIVFHEGDPGDTLHLIDRGHVAVRVSTPAGDVATLQVHGPGNHFGELAALTDGRRSATVSALDRTETLEVSAADITRFQCEHPLFEQAVRALLAETIRTMSALLVEARYLPAPRRIARRLVSLADTFDGDVIPLTQDDLAGLSGATRQTVNQVLTDLRDRGLIDVARGRITVLDRDALSRAAH